MNPCSVASVWQFLVAVLLSFAMAACGGGGEGEKQTSRIDPPTITSQPRSQSIQAGQGAAFSVTVEGSQPITYQWMKNGAAIAGATTSVFGVPVTTVADSGAQYSVSVTGPGGSVISSSATLTVVTALALPTIDVQPADVTVAAGQVAQFSVKATSAAPFTYQWRKNGVEIARATEAVYSTPAATINDNGVLFSVAVKNAAGTVVSTAARLSVVPATVAPSIARDPTSVNAIAGQTVSFTVVASGTSPLSYQWQRNGADITGASASSYSLVAVESDNDARFAVRVTNPAGSVTSVAATLTVSDGQTQLSTATLAPSVRLLTPNEESQIVGSSDKDITFAGPIVIPVGTVVVGSDKAFKVVATRLNGTRTVVTTAEPSIDELFASLRLKGNYVATSAMAASASETSPGGRRNATSASNDVSRTLSWSFALEDAGLKFSGRFTSTVGAAIDYDYQRDAGGLRSAQLDVTMKSKLDLSSTYEQSAQTNYERQIGRVRIPINLTLLDSALRVVGVRVVSIYIPVYAGARLRAGMSLIATDTISADGAIQLRYDQLRGASASSTFSGGLEPASMNPRVPAGMPVFATVALDASAYVRVAPALAFLDKVALLGVDTSLSFDNAVQLQVVPASPAYCLTYVPSLSVAANGFFKSVGVGSLTTDVYRSTLFRGEPNYVGSCRAPVKVSGSADINGAVLDVEGKRAAFGSHIPVSATVSLGTNASGTPTDAPTGDVVFTTEGDSCRAALVAKSRNSATATCKIQPLTFGAAVPIAISYAGDRSYSPGMGETHAPIARPIDSLLGSRVTVEAHAPTYGHAYTNPLTVRIGPGVEFSSGSLTIIESGRSLIGSTVNIGSDYIDLLFTQSAMTLSGAFNGIVYKLDDEAPEIQSCTLSPKSSLKTSQVAVTCTKREVRVSVPGISVKAGDRVIVLLTFVSR